MTNPDSEPPSTLHLASTESPEELGHRFERERRALQVQREEGLGNSLSPFRVGSVPYLNAVPLTRGIEDQIILGTPAELAEMLRRDALDAALVSLAEVLLTDRYDILDGIALASLGEVKSVLLAHRIPLNEIARVYCDPASLTGFQLVRALLAERGLRPEFTQLDKYENVAGLDAVLLIGDTALDFLHSPGEHQIWDLGAAWYELTNLPFVYAVWALRRGVPNTELRRRLHEVKDFGLETLDYIISSRTEYTYDFRKDYLGWHMHYHLGSDEKRGIARFMELLEKHGCGPVYPPRFVA
jgi:chorismate dehydratase